MEVILAVDAIHIEPTTTLLPSGELTGLVDQKLAPKITSQQQLLEYLENNKSNRAAAAHVFFCLDITGKLMPLPVHVMFQSSGKANDDVVERLIRIKNECQRSMFKVIGYSTDGDSSYYSCCIEPLYNLFSKFWLNNGIIVDLYQFKHYLPLDSMGMKLFFPDVLHLLKNLLNKILLTKK